MFLPFKFSKKFISILPAPELQKCFPEKLSVHSILNTYILKKKTIYAAITVNLDIMKQETFRMNLNFTMLCIIIRNSPFLNVMDSYSILFQERTVNSGVTSVLPSIEIIATHLLIFWAFAISNQCVSISIECVSLTLQCRCLVLFSYSPYILVSSGSSRSAASDFLYH